MVSDIQAGDGNIGKFFLLCGYILPLLSPALLIFYKFSFLSGTGFKHCYAGMRDSEQWKQVAEKCAQDQTPHNFYMCQMYLVGFFSNVFCEAISLLNFLLLYKVSCLIRFQTRLYEKISALLFHRSACKIYSKRRRS